MSTRPEGVWSRGIVIVVRRHDAHAAWTWIAVVGLAAAAMLAIVGGPGVDLHGPFHRLGIMDPLCGATRSVYLTLHGRVADAVRFNPAGPVLITAAVLALSRAIVGHTVRYWVHVQLPRPVWMATTVVAIVALEVNQQVHVALLTSPWSGG